jgi:hypothetical protein
LVSRAMRGSYPGLGEADKITTSMGSVEGCCPVSAVAASNCAVAGRAGQMIRALRKLKNIL